MTQEQLNKLWEDYRKFCENQGYSDNWEHRTDLVINFLSWLAKIYGIKL